MKNTFTHYFKSLVLVGILMFGLSAITAQRPHKGKHSMHPDSAQIVKMIDELTTKLSLNEAQTASIKELHLEHVKSVKAKMENNAEHKKEERQKMEAARNELENKVVELLTAEQKKKYKEFKESHKPPCRESGRPPKK